MVQVQHSVQRRRARAIAKKRSAALAFCIMLLGTAPAWALTPYDRTIGSRQQQFINEYTEATQNGGISGPDERHAADRPLVIEMISPQKTPQETEQDERERKNKRWYDRAGLIIGVVTGCSVLLQTVIFGFQAYIFGLQAKRLRQTIDAMRDVGTKQSNDMQGSIAAAQRSADAALKAAEVTELALQEGETPYLFPIMQADGPNDIPRDGDNRRPYVLHNFGRSVAIVLEIYQDCFYTGQQQPPAPFPPPQRVGSTTNFIGAGENSFQIRFAPTSRVMREGGETVTGNGCLIGQVRYADVYGNQFITGYYYIFADTVRAPASVNSAGYNYRRKLTPEELVIAERRDRMLD